MNNTTDMLLGAGIVRDDARAAMSYTLRPRVRIPSRVDFYRQQQRRADFIRKLDEAQGVGNA